MISIIVCSVNEKFFKTFSENVSRTIGLPYEIIKMENAVSICKAYNEGALKAKYPYICFAHEDVDIKTDSWGTKIINHFEMNGDCGLLGIAGCIYKTKMIAWWSHSRILNVETKRINVIQDYKYNQKRLKETFLLNPFNESRSEVTNLDGVFLATTKDVWESNKFDEKLLTGFHGYDVDFSLQIGRLKKMYVIYDVVMEHFSEGNFDCACLLDYFKVHKKWKKNLPLLCGNYSINKEYRYEQNLIHLRKHIKMLIRNDFSFFYIQKKYFFLLTLFDIDCGYFLFFKYIFTEWFFTARFFLSYRIRAKKNFI
jgi:hypothetical protein